MARNSNEINENRKIFGEYHHLFPILKKYPSKFQEYTRMKIDTFNYILSKVEQDLQKNWCNLHQQPILPEEQLVITIRFLVTGMSYSALSFAFRMGTSTICGVIKRTMEVLWKKLYPIHMPVPTEEQLSKIAEEFYTTWNFPNCIGAIDVSHVEINQPPNSGSMYFNYKKYFSITLQAIVDAKYKFISIDVGGYGRQHDSSTFKSSKFYAALQRKIVKIPKTKKLPNSETVAPHFFIGDGAYPLMQHLLKPYPGFTLTTSQRTFNKRLSRARLVVECAFGKLHQKWQIFYKNMPYLPNTAVLIAKCACILHNVIIDMEGKDDFNREADESDEEDLWNEEDCISDEEDISDDDSENDSTSGNQDNFPVGLGNEVRQNLTTFVMENPI